MKTVITILIAIVAIFIYLLKKPKQAQAPTPQTALEADTTKSTDNLVAKTLPSGVSEVVFTHSITGLYTLSPEEQVLGRPFTIEELEARRSALGVNEVILPDGLTMMIQGEFKKGEWPKQDQTLTQTPILL